ncbi:type II toxin-antitoxin system HipA family toxin [Aliidiomarina sp.]|uniref:type II toxin-antitoxin system HipA family toxin n=1 Tax=Aliidiomarina sp. TaxID=1872439 RepID=UPI003A4D4887
MGRRKHENTLHCHMNDQFVGTLKSRLNNLRFRYSDSWLQSNFARAISVSMPLTEQEYSGEALNAYFDNLLPDSLDVRKYIVDRLGAKSTKPFDLLETVGKDCIGALTFLAIPEPQPVPDVKIIPLNEEQIGQLIADSRTGKTLGMQHDDAFRFSLAGAQEKTALTFWQGQWGIPVGRTPTTHILKPRIITRPGEPDLSSSVENEWFCMRVVQALGLPVAHTKIDSFNGEDVLIIERFDRKIIENKIYRLPQEDFCQALGVTGGSKYEEYGGPSAKEIMKILSTSTASVSDQDTFMSAQLLYWLFAAIDGHAKNFSLALTPRGYRLTPLYDVLSAYGFAQVGNLHPKKIKMAMAVNSKNRHYQWHTILPRHWRTHAKSVGYDPERMDSTIANITSKLESCLDIASEEAASISVRAELSAEAIRKGTLKALERFKV